jgi:phosphonoacetaldehyde hydrolase
MRLPSSRAYRGSVKAVILDWAGTSVDYGSFAPMEVFLRLFQAHGLPVTIQDIRAGMGLMKKDHLRAILSQPGVASAWQALHGGPPSPEDVERLFAEFVPMQLEVLVEHAKPIPGLLEVVEQLRYRGIKIGSTTGYTRAMMEVLAPEAKRFGYEPDCIVCPDEVPGGRPYPWMCYQNAARLGVYPMQAMIKVGDTPVDVEEGLNAGMWTVGVTQTGNLLGLNEAEVNALTPRERKAANQRVAPQLYKAGAHEVLDGIWDLFSVLSRVEARLAVGDHP